MKRLFSAEEGIEAYGQVASPVEAGEAGFFKSPVLFQYSDPSDGVPHDRILDIFDLHPVADQGRS